MRRYCGSAPWSAATTIPAAINRLDVAGGRSASESIRPQSRRLNHLRLRAPVDFDPARPLLRDDPPLRDDAPLRDEALPRDDPPLRVDRALAVLPRDPVVPREEPADLPRPPAELAVFFAPPPLAAFLPPARLDAALVRDPPPLARDDPPRPLAPRLLDPPRELALRLLDPRPPELERELPRPALRDLAPPLAPPRALLPLPPPERLFRPSSAASAVSRLTILLKLLCAPPAVCSW
jgi:hypothetical protein